jgi:hypothetical protein
MLGNYSYHEIIRKTIIGFGTLFNNIYIKHYDKDDTNVIDEMRVPLAYAPRQKFLARLTQQSELNKSVAITLPRMSFEMVSLQYDTSRKTGVTQTFKASDGVNLKKVFMPVPYNIGFELSIYCKLNDDALQIVEQILPTFNPQYSLTIKPFADYPNITEDTPITLTSVDFNDDYEGTLEARRTIIYTLTFDMRVNFYGGINEVGIIRTSINNVNEIGGGLADSDVQIGKISVTTDPALASADSDYGFNETFDFEAPF